MGLWPYPATGTTDYIFNNLIYDVGPMEYINIGQSGTAVGNYTFFNNTFQSNANQTIFNCNYLSGGMLTDTNNHFIDDGTQYSSPCNNRTTTTALRLTNAQATADGYTSSEIYGYSPTSGSSPTVRAGTNEYSLTVARSGRPTSGSTNCLPVGHGLRLHLQCQLSHDILSNESDEYETVKWCVGYGRL